MWKEEPDDAILVLMLHSDCEGIIPTRFCAPLAERLRLIALSQEGWCQDATWQFEQGLMLAFHRGEDVDFH